MDAALTFDGQGAVDLDSHLPIVGSAMSDERLMGAIEKIQSGDTEAVNEGLQELHGLADEGNAAAYYNLGYCYYQGRGVAQNYEQAYEYMEKSFEAGDIEGLAGMGLMHLRGDGVEQDIVEAKTMLVAALRQRSVNAGEHLPAFTDDEENVVVEEQTGDDEWIVHGYDHDQQFIFRTKITGFTDEDELHEFARYVIGEELIESINRGAEPTGWADFEGHTVNVLEFDRLPDVGS